MTPDPLRSAASAAAPSLPSGNPYALTVRKLEIDLSAGFDRHWHGGDAFLSQYLNALSMSFPVGEQSFIDAVRDCAKLLPRTPATAALHDAIAQFIGQEATHRHIHGLYNAQLEKQGLVNRWQHWATARIDYATKRGVGPRHFLAVTAAYEHLTAVLADHMLRHGDALGQADPKMQTLWRWHAAEETEHRAVAYDLYQALGGNHAWRIRWYAYALLLFCVDSGRQTALNLWRDGSLFKPATWWSATKYFWGKHGVVWHCTAPLLAYFRRDFHPDQEAVTAPGQQTSAIAQRWLKEHDESFRVVR
ncbi:metal-dependent hydrolase [Polaromonas sp.]|uniref:metal-dependent hydrolase n=1 Tax=Polaromonas sp. TaxID=1869339 RepID=UPI003264A7AF